MVRPFRLRFPLREEAGIVVSGSGGELHDAMQLRATVVVGRQAGGRIFASGRETF